MHDSERFKLLGGPYPMPRCKDGVSLRVYRLSSWDNLPDYVARTLAAKALYTMKKEAGGAFTRTEIREIVEDVMGLPQSECDVDKWSKQRCEELILRLLARGLIYDRGPHES